MPKKVEKVNLEQGQPSVEQALQKLRNDLSTLKRQGTKAAIIIHGWGSSGVGGSIKPAVRKALGDSSMRGIVRASVGGEDWAQKRREFIGMCKALEEEDRQLTGNPGVTVVILR